MDYTAKENRYEKMHYRRCGKSGLKLPAISLGLWHNFGDVDVASNFKNTLFTAFDLGITHFDLANNYGPPPGSAEENFGKFINKELKGYRDELVISSKAGYYMWPGPYGEWGSKKSIIASLDQSLRRLKLDYVDIFYHHRPDPETPLYETMSALDLIVRQGKALYIGLSNYGPERAKEAIDILETLGTPCLIHQPKYSMFERAPEKGLLEVLDKNGVGCIPFSPLAQGLLTDKYLHGIKEGSRASRSVFLKPEHITDEKLAIIEKLNNKASSRGQTLAQMAVGWLLKDNRITSVLVGASKAQQLVDAVGCLNNLSFTEQELKEIEVLLKSNE